MNTDLLRKDATTQAERKVAQGAAPVYMYLFAWPTPVLGGKFKATHGIELPFVFDNLDKVPDMVGPAAGLQPLAVAVSGAWAEFARTGSPGHRGLPSWPVYTVADRATMVLNRESKVVNDQGRDERLALAGLGQG